MVENTSIVFPEPNRIRLEERSVPEPDPHQVLVDTKCSLISTGTELAWLSGEPLAGLPDNDQVDSNWNPGPKHDVLGFPRYPGYASVGKIVKTGSEMNDAVIGERVVHRKPHQKFVVVSNPSSGMDPDDDRWADQNDTYRLIPDDVTDEQGVFSSIAEIVMNGLRRGRVTWGERVAVFGLGLLGQLAVRLCDFAGVQTVIGIDKAGSRIEYLPHRPQIVGLNPDEDDLETEVRNETSGELAEVVVELTGNPQAIPTEVEILREGGRFLIISSPRGETPFNFNELCSLPSYEIIGSHRSSHPPVATPRNPWTQERHAELFLDALARGEISVDELVSHTFPADQAGEAYTMLLEDRKRALGVLLKW